jgi:hypothetical protein
MGISRLNVFKKNKAGAEPQPLEIGDPVSKNFDYGDSIPPWLNNYADLRNIEVDQYVHAARDGYFDREKQGFAALQTFGSTTWVHGPNDAKQPKAVDDLSLRSSSSSDDGSIATLNSPPAYDNPTQPEHRGLRKCLFRNRGRNADGSLRDEYDDYSMPDWGMPDEYATPRRRFWH